MRSRYRLGHYLAGATAARTGDELSGPALLLLGLAVTGSVSTASALLAALTASAALGGPVLGAMLDRSPAPGRLLTAALAGYAAGLTVLLTGTGPLPTAVLLGVALLTGLLNPATSGGWTAQLPEVAPGPGFARANTLDAMTFGFASLTGPALAGLLATALGAPAALVTAIVLVAAALPAAWALPARPARPAQPAPGRGGGLHRDVRAGFAAIVASRPLLGATAASVVSFAGVGMLVVCCPLLGLRLFGDTGYGGLLLAVLAATAMTANALLARRPGLLRPDTIVPASAVLIGAGTLVASAATQPWVAIAAVLVAGAGEGPQLTALFAIRHREAPPGLRAQIFTTGASLKITGFAAGSALAGPLAAHSPSLCLLSATACELGAVLVYLAVRRPSPAPCA